LGGEFVGRIGPTDAELVRAVLQGNSEAFGVLVRRHVRAGHAVAMSILGDADEADDVCQDGFILALERLHQLREPSRFRSWLHSVIRNRALNVQASRSRRAGPELAELRVVSGLPAPDWEVERSEVREEIRKAAECLTVTQERVFLLHDVEGMTHGEIAESLGISIGSSRVHLHMARRAVRSRLSQCYAKVLG